MLPVLLEMMAIKKSYSTKPILSGVRFDALPFCCCRLVMIVDGKPIPFSRNSTILYTPEGKQNGSLFNTVQVAAVDVSHADQADALKIDMTSLVERGRL